MNRKKGGDDVDDDHNGRLEDVVEVEIDVGMSVNEKNRIRKIGVGVGVGEKRW